MHETIVPEVVTLITKRLFCWRFIYTHLLLSRHLCAITSFPLDFSLYKTCLMRYWATNDHCSMPQVMKLSGRYIDLGASIENLPSSTMYVRSTRPSPPQREAGLSKTYHMPKICKKNTWPLWHYLLFCFIV